MAKTILVVDDDPVVVKYLTTVLTDGGYNTITAASGKEAFKILEDNKPDLITLDLEMPGEWGSKVYRKISKDESLKDIPVIVISGMSGRHAVKNAVAYLPKPFDPDKLLSVVRKSIG